MAILVTHFYVWLFVCQYDEQQVLYFFSMLVLALLLISLTRHFVVFLLSIYSNINNIWSHTITWPAHFDSTSTSFDSTSTSFDSTSTSFCFQNSEVCSCLTTSAPRCAITWSHCTHELSNLTIFFLFLLIKKRWARRLGADHVQPQGAVRLCRPCVRCVATPARAHIHACTRTWKHIAALHTWTPSVRCNVLSYGMHAHASMPTQDACLSHYPRFSLIIDTYDFLSRKERHRPWLAVRSRCVCMWQAESAGDEAAERSARGTSQHLEPTKPAKSKCIAVCQLN